MVTMKTFKTFLTEEPVVLKEAAFKAEDWEAAIVMGFLFNNSRPISDPDSIGISKKVFDMIQANPEIEEAGRKIAAAVQHHFGLNGNEKAEQYGRASTKLTKFWQQYDAGNKTPKTDILIGDKRLSLKMGNAQLMSGGRAESTATFNAALQKVPELMGSPQVQKIQQVLNSFVERALAPGQLRGIIKSGENDVVNAAEEAHKACMAELNKLFEESNQFKIEFAREAMSGFSKYGEKSDAAAEFMLVATPDGKAQIHSVYDDAYCSSVANKMRLQARFKTSSRKLGGKKTGEYNFWSVVSLIVNAIDESIDEYEHGMYTLNEANILQNLTARAKKFLSQIWGRMKNFFQKGVRNVMRFLSPQPPEITFNNEIKF